MGVAVAQVDRGLNTAADEVHNFELVSAADCGRRPSGTRNDFAIVLDGNTVSLELERSDETVKGRGRRKLWKAALAAVELNAKKFHLFSVAGTFRGISLTSKDAIFVDMQRDSRVALGLAR